jgi:hypothetical protein
MKYELIPFELQYRHNVTTIVRRQREGENEHYEQDNDKQ